VKHTCAVNTSRKVQAISN